MTDAFLSTVRARRGHFKLESGHHGDFWLDLETLCLRPAHIRPFGRDFTYAERFVDPTRETLFPVDYRLPSILGPLVRGRRVAIVNDVIGAGSAVRGAFASLHALSARVVVIGSLAVLGTSIAGFARERDVPVEALAYLPNNMWAPTDCPLCRSGVPLEMAGS